MKKLVLVMLALVAVGSASVFAEADTYSKPGSLTAQGGLGLYWGLLGGFSVAGGCDYSVYQLAIAPVVPLDLGASARASFGSWGGAGVGAFATAHYSWKALGLNLDWLNHVETYLGLGLQVVPGLGLAGYSGTAYHIDQHLAVFAEYDAIGAGTVVGASYKF